MTPRPLRGNAASLALALGALAAGCTRLAPLATETVVTCAATAECPAGRACQRGRCVDPGVIDTTPPDLAGGVTVTPARVRAGEPFTVALEVTELLAGRPRVTLALAPEVALDCVASGATRYTCSHTPGGGENRGSGGEIALDVELQDLAGNETRRSGVARVALDFAPPAPTLASVGYEPAPTNPLATVARATTGTTVRVVVSADELLSPTRARALVGRCGDARLAFAPAAVPALAGNEAAFEATVGMEPDGVYTLAVTWADDLGNEGTAAVPQTVEVKTSAPVLRVDQDALVFVRSPIGNAADEVLGDHVIPRGPYFAVEPGDVFTTVATLPAGALLLDEAAPGGSRTVLPSLVVVQSTADAGTSLLLGVLRPADGRFPRQKLASPDLAGVWLVGVDDAGNRSAAVPLRDAEWVATPGPPAFGVSPHPLVLTASAGPARLQEAELRPVSASAAAAPDGEALFTPAAGVWRAASTASAPARGGHSVAYDVARDRLVVFGGDSPTTLEWDGASWAVAATSGPTVGARPAMAYDAARGRVVALAGGGGPEPWPSSHETWEWDGHDWIRRATTGPGDRVRAAMVYDGARGRIVLHGGKPSYAIYGRTANLADTWEWDGESWTSVSTAGPAVSYHAMAYDALRRRIVLFGGTDGVLNPLAATWEYDPSTRDWRQVATTGPSARYQHGMTYDPVRHKVVLHGGAAAADMDTWEWGGTVWKLVATGGPFADDLSLAYDAARRDVVLFQGGENTWRWDGSSWRQSAGRAPSARTGAAVAFDAARQRTVLFGGFGTTGVDYLGDTWEWDGDSWTSVATGGPGPRAGAAIAFDDARRCLVMLNGYSGSARYDDTWEWCGSVRWRQVAVGGIRPARSGAAAAFHASSGRTVVFGGGGGTGAEWLGDTWGWNGTDWATLATTGPAPRAGHAMVYDAARDRTVLFGGSGARGPLGDTWEWNGSTWTEMVTTPTPGPRNDAPMVYDANRRRVVLMGGNGVAVTLASDVWEWDGMRWSQVSATGPEGRMEHAIAYDGARRELVVFGGYTRFGSMRDTWTWRVDPEHVPATTFLAAFPLAGVPAARVGRVHVRLFGGGTSLAGASPAAGATLLGWAVRGDGGEPGAWLPLAVNHTGAAAQPPHLPAPASSRFDWVSASPDDARRYLVERDGFTFRLQPTGAAGADPAGASVALDYVEVRVRYRAPGYPPP